MIPAEQAESIVSRNEDPISKIRKAFKDRTDTVVALAILGGPPSDAGEWPEGTGLDPDLSEDGVLEALKAAAKGFDLGDGRLAMPYCGFYTAPKFFRNYSYDTDLDCRPRMNVMILTREDGESVRGVIPMKDFEPDIPEFLELVGKRKDCILVTDGSFYSRENSYALSRTDAEWVFRFRYYAEHANIPEMQDLKSNGRTLKACKCRYDKRWLFRFLDPEAKSKETSRIKSNPDIGPRDKDWLLKGAGVTDALSATGFDIRHVREILDARESWDARMRGLWARVGEYAPAAYDEKMAAGLLTVLVLGELLRGD